MNGAISIFTMDLWTVSTGILFRTARRIGLGFCGQDKSGTFIPQNAKNNGIIRITKCIHRLCLANIPMAAT